MEEYITKKDALLALDEAVELSCYDYEKIENAINGLQAADVVPVVHCKDCESAQNKCDGMIICRAHKHIMCLHDFCSHGKRRDDADNDCNSY